MAAEILPEWPNISDKIRVLQDTLTEWEDALSGSEAAYDEWLPYWEAEKTLKTLREALASQKESK